MYPRPTALKSSRLLPFPKRMLPIQGTRSRPVTPSGLMRVLIVQLGAVDAFITFDEAATQHTSITANYRRVSAG
jgi:hypothetical protein